MISSFSLFLYFYLYLKLPTEILQTAMFLKLLVAGHMTIYLTRSGNRRFWRPPWPDSRLLVALESTQAIGTAMALAGLLVHPIGWKLVLEVWGYAIIWMVVLDQVKLWTSAYLSRSLESDKPQRNDGRR